MVKGKCKLCLKDNVEIVNSHIVPSWAYKRIRENNSKQPDPICIERDKTYSTSKQLKEYMLCKDCESKIKVFEDFASEITYNKNGDSSFISNYKGECKEYTELKVYSLNKDQAESLRKFALSVAWRASIAKSKKLKGVDLGEKYNEIARLSLNNEIEIPQNISIFCYLHRNIHNNKLYNFIEEPKTYKEKKYHLNKTEECEKHGIQLVHIWEDNWNNKQDVVKSMILNKLYKTPNKIYARKTEVKEITDNKLIREFLDKNHLQGFIGSKVKLGLFLDNELVSLMTFGKRRVVMGKKSTNDGEYELLRFCNKLNINIIGGASKLFKHFIRNYKPKEITTYADRSHSNGNLYEVLGFDFVGETQPNYYYVIDGIRKHRFNFRKDVLIKQGFDPNKTEHQIMIDRKIYKIFDSGNLKFNKTL